MRYLSCHITLPRRCTLRRQRWFIDARVPIRHIPVAPFPGQNFLFGDDSPGSLPGRIPSKTMPANGCPSLMVFGGGFASAPDIAELNGWQSLRDRSPRRHQDLRLRALAHLEQLLAFTRILEERWYDAPRILFLDCLVEHSVRLNYPRGDESC